jgi:hypothetical protein
VFRADYDPVPPLPAAPAALPDGTVISHRGLSRLDALDPARLLRELELEVVFRDRAMVDHVARQDLYRREGLGARNRAQNAALERGDLAAAHVLEVSFPLGATMVKTDFLHQDVMLARGLIASVDDAGRPLDPPNDPDHPYLTMRLAGTGAPGEVPGTYYLVAMTNASKALPIWHWYAIEHVANLGRCDYIGCNDSFGYAVPGTLQPGADYGTGFIPPHMVRSGVRQGSDELLFDVGRTYLPDETGEEPTEALLALLDGMGIGTAETDPDPGAISPDDPAWRSYRLKGTQTTFTTAGGVPTGMGATVTEGGFVNSASCTTCHAEASVDASGAAGMQGVGSTWPPNVMGFNQVRMGAPDLRGFGQHRRAPRHGHADRLRLGRPGRRLHRARRPGRRMRRIPRRTHDPARGHARLRPGLARAAIPSRFGGRGTRGVTASRPTPPLVFARSPGSARPPCAILLMTPPVLGPQTYPRNLRKSSAGPRMTTGAGRWQGTGLGWAAAR